MAGRSRFRSLAKVFSASAFVSAPPPAPAACSGPLLPASRQHLPFSALECLARAAHPGFPRYATVAPHFPSAAPLPTGLPSGPFGAVSSAWRCELGEQEPPGPPRLLY